MGKPKSLVGRAFIMTLAFMVTCLVFVGSVAAQENEAGTAGSSEQRADGPPDEIVVKGHSRRWLRKEGARETEAFYMQLNRVLDNDEFTITCKSEPWPGRRTGLHRVCRTRFRERLEALSATTVTQNGTDAGIVSASDYYLTARLRVLQKEFDAAVLNAINSNPELNRRVQRLVALKNEYESRQWPRHRR